MVDHLKFKALTWTSTQDLEHCTLDADKRGWSIEQTGLPKWADARNVTSSPTISVISDFPHLHSPEAQSQFCDNLMVLVQSAKRPTILLVTESGLYAVYHKGASEMGLHRSMLLVLY